MAGTKANRKKHHKKKQQQAAKHKQQQQQVTPETGPAAAGVAGAATAAAGGSSGEQGLNKENVQPVSGNEQENPEISEVPVEPVAKQTPESVKVGGESKVSEGITKEDEESRAVTDKADMTAVEKDISTPAPEEPKELETSTAQVSKETRKAEEAATRLDGPKSAIDPQLQLQEEAKEEAATAETKEEPASPRASTQTPTTETAEVQGSVPTCIAGEQQEKSATVSDASRQPETTAPQPEQQQEPATTRQAPASSSDVSKQPEETPMSNTTNTAAIPITIPSAKTAPPITTTAVKEEQEKVQTPQVPEKKSATTSTTATNVPAVTAAGEQEESSSKRRSPTWEETSERYSQFLNKLQSFGSESQPLDLTDPRTKDQQGKAHEGVPEVASNKAETTGGETKAQQPSSSSSNRAEEKPANAAAEASSPPQAPRKTPPVIPPPKDLEKKKLSGLLHPFKKDSVSFLQKGFFFSFYFKRTF